MNPKPRHQNYVKIECSCLKCGRNLQARIIKSRKISWGFAHDHKNRNVKCGESLISRNLKLEFYYIWIILLQVEIILVSLNNKPASAGVTIPLDVYVAHCGCRTRAFRSASPVHKESKNIPVTVQHLFLSLNDTVMLHTDYLHFWTHSSHTFIAGLCVPNCTQCTVKQFKFKTTTYGAGVWI